MKERITEEKLDISQGPSTAWAVIYIAIAAVICLVPSVGLLFGGGEVSSDSDAAPEPKLALEDGSFNFNVLSDAGDWFDDHFAFRNEWVTAAAALEGGVFGVSPNESVVYGTDGWLYYGDSVDDFRGTDQLNDRQLFDIAHSMKLVQTYALGHGIDFAFMISPNKNTLYGQDMPYYYQVHVGDANLDRIKPFLEAEGVNYVDARELFEGQGNILYHKRDSHWNNVGAAMVADALLASVSHEHRSYADEPYTTRDDFVGDLDKMLFPSAPAPESECYYDDAPAFEYVTEDVQSNFDPKIETASAADDVQGSLVMYRDSFGNSLLPFMAEAFQSAYFSRAVPYQLAIDLTAHDADTLVIERAQRFMRDMAANPPMMPAPMLLDEQLAGATGGNDAESADEGEKGGEPEGDEGAESAEGEGAGSADEAGAALAGGEGADGGASAATFTALDDVEELVQGDYMRVTGDLPVDGVAVDARIAIRVNGSLTYEAFGASDAETSQERFQLLVPRTVVQDDGNIYELLVW